MHLEPENVNIWSYKGTSSVYTAFLYFSMVLDRSGRVLISNNLETFVCDGTDKDVACFAYVTNCLHYNVQFCRSFKYIKRQICYSS